VANGRVAIIAPMLDEAAHIEQLVEDIASQDFDGEYELHVADGGSADDSVARLAAACGRAGLKLTVVHNPERWVSHGLNACIRGLDADLIVRMDCHTRYPKDYLRLLVDAVEESGAWQAGGLLVPVGGTTTERAVAAAMDSPFGGVHWTRHAASPTPVEVDTVYCGAYRPIVFERAGLFDEGLVRNQDDDLAFRIRAAGGTVILDPSIRSHYVPRGSLRRVARQYFEYGYWKVALTRKHRRVISCRSLAPAALLGSLGVLLVLAPFFAAARVLLGAELAAYVTTAAIFAVVAARTHGEPLRLAPRIATVFPAFHFGYGVGILTGLLRRARAEPSPAATLEAC